MLNNNQKELMEFNNDLSMKTQLCIDKMSESEKKAQYASIKESMPQIQDNCLDLALFIFIYWYFECQSLQLSTNEEKQKLFWDLISRIEEVARILKPGELKLK